MKSSLLTLALTATLAAGGAFAQTAVTASTGAASGAYGGDWSTSLKSAVFSDDGETVRSDSELSRQLATLSDEDKATLRRDCDAHEAQAGVPTGGTSGASGGTTGATGTAADAAAGMTEVSMEQMDEICEATGDI